MRSMCYPISSYTDEIYGYPWIFAIDVPCICSADPHDDMLLMEIVPGSVVYYALPLTHDDVAF
jgi:hypothetical protein